MWSQSCGICQFSSSCDRKNSVICVHGPLSKKLDENRILQLSRTSSLLTWTPCREADSVPTLHLGYIDVGLTNFGGQPPKALPYSLGEFNGGRETNFQSFRGWSEIVWSLLVQRGCVWDRGQFSFAWLGSWSSQPNLTWVSHGDCRTHSDPVRTKWGQATSRVDFSYIRILPLWIRRLQYKFERELKMTRNIFYLLPQRNNETSKFVSQQLESQERTPFPRGAKLVRLWFSLWPYHRLFEW